jgi:hypothetical protein
VGKRRAGTDASGANSVLARLCPADQRLVELNRNAGLQLRTLTESRNAVGCIFEAEEHISFRKWLDLWIRQTLLRCPEGAPC